MPPRAHAQSEAGNRADVVDTGGTLQSNPLRPQACRNADPARPDRDRTSRRETSGNGASPLPETMTRTPAPQTYGEGPPST
jgi:hypothetical protein